MSLRRDDIAPRLAFAVALDAGNRAAARAGRAVWNDGDHECACETFFEWMRAGGLFDADDMPTERYWEFIGHPRGQRAP